MKGAQIAELKLQFSDEGSTDRKPLRIRIFAPQPVDPASVSFPVDADVAGCVVEFDGLPDAARDRLGADSINYGADSIQALQLAVDVDRILKRLSEHYDFYFPIGEGYFDE
jgi:hypothetical protein